MLRGNGQCRLSQKNCSCVSPTLRMSPSAMVPCVVVSRLSAVGNVGQMVSGCHAARTGARSASVAGAWPSCSSTELSSWSDSKSGAVISIPMA